MPIQGDEYIPYTQEQLYEQRASLLSELTNGDIEDFEGSIVQALLQADAQLLAENQEQSLKRLHDNAFLESAEGEYLDLKVQELGISRNLSTPSTGVAKFVREEVALNEYIIKRNTPITTENGTVEFKSTEKGSLNLLSGFNGASLSTDWSGDTTSFETTTTYVNNGTHSLEIGATNNVAIWRTDVSVARGDIIEYSPRLSSDNVVGFWFGVQDTNNYFEARINATTDTLSLIEVSGGTENTLTSISVSVPTDSFITVEVDVGITEEITIQLIDGNDNSLDSISYNVSEFTEGGIGVESQDGNSIKYLDTVSRTATTLNIEAVDGGENTNVGADRITVMPSPPTGITDVTNPVPTGNREYLDTNDERLVVGTDREEDEDLRERAIETSARGGAGTPRSIYTAIRDINNVIHVDWNENDDVSTVDGLPPLSIEFIVCGGNDKDIAETIHKKVGITERLTSGVNGSSTTYTITDDLLGDSETYEWSKPPFVSVDITIDIVVEDTYEGDEAVKSTIANYIGGTDVDGGEVNGLGIGEEIRHDAIRDILVGDELGVRGIASLTIDSNGDGTDDTTTNANGLKVLDVADNEVPEVNATDGSITITTTTV